jgi:hypothetical protein
MAAEPIRTAIEAGSSAPAEGYRAQMANDAGHLPKADPETLSPALRERLAVWFDKAYCDDNLFLTLAERPAVLDLFLGWVKFIYTNESSLDPKMVELCRIRMAVRNQCVH